MFTLIEGNDKCQSEISENKCIIFLVQIQELPEVDPWARIGSMQAGNSS